MNFILKHKLTIVGIIAGAIGGYLYYHFVGCVSGTCAIKLKHIKKMLDTLKQLLGFAPKVDYGSLVRQGAMIVDVRTKSEYQQGHIKGSQNIPLNNLSTQYPKWNKDKPIIMCCASGMRSSQAKSILTSYGFKEDHFLNPIFGFT